LCHDDLGWKVGGLESKRKHDRAGDVDYGGAAGEKTEQLGNDPAYTAFGIRLCDRPSSYVRRRRSPKWKRTRTSRIEMSKRGSNLLVSQAIRVRYIIEAR
jgi:hypothetical protein